MSNFDFLIPDGNLRWKLYTFYFTKKNARLSLKNVSALYKNYSHEVPLPLVNVILIPLGYLQLALIPIYVNSFARLQLSFRHLQKSSCKCKSIIISDVDYRPGSKKSKFDMFLISDSPLKKTLNFLCVNASRTK